MRQAGSPWMVNPGLQRSRIAKRRKFFPQHCGVLSMLRASPGWPSVATRRTHAFDPGMDLRRPKTVTCDLESILHIECRFYCWVTRSCTLLHSGVEVNFKNP
jgi:hypothetical protein